VATPPPPSIPVPDVPRSAWSQSIAASNRGLALAREKGWLLAWDENHWLYLFDHKGHRQAQRHTPGLTAACCAEDGSSYAAVGEHGEVWWLAPDLMPRWERAVPHRSVAAAMDSFGQYLAVADSRGHLHFIDRQGRPVHKLDSPRPLHHLTFIPAAPYLLGSADYGLVICFDLEGRTVWRDGLVAHVGALAVNGDGERIVLACFTEGLQHYSLKGKNLGRIPYAGTCSLAALSFDGSQILTANLANQIHLLDRDGKILCIFPLEKPAVALAFAALGETAVVAVSGGPILGLELRSGPLKRKA